MKKYLKIFLLLALAANNLDNITDEWYCWMEGDKVVCSEVAETEPEEKR